MVDSKLTMPVNFKGSQPQIQRIKKQDEEEHWISEEELYTEGSSDEEKPQNSSRKHNSKGRKSHSREKAHSQLSNIRSCTNEKSNDTDSSGVSDMNAIDQRDISWRPKRGSIKLPGVDLSEIIHSSGMSRQDILATQDDLSDMKKSVQRLEDTLSNFPFANEIYDIGKLREEARKDRETSKLGELERMAEYTAEMKELDNALRAKNEEIKMAKIERMREVVESQDLLNELSKSLTSGAIKNNSEQFMKLLKCEASEYSGDNSESGKPIRVMKKEKAKQEDPSRKQGTFIERNIQLAKCGNGVLSLTDEEKLRLKIVLEDIVDDGDEVAKDRQTKDAHHAFKEEIQKALQEIDRKLEEYRGARLSLSGPRNSEDGPDMENPKTDKKDKSKAFASFGNEFRRLREVDKLLKSLTSATQEEIDPLQEEDLRYLIEESRQILTTGTSGSDSLDDEDNSETSWQEDRIAVTPSREVLTELVSAAKSNMPNFKFRYDH